MATEFAPLPVGPSAGMLAPPVSPDALPDACLDEMMLSVDRDSVCYREVAAATAAEVAAGGPQAPLCWGYSGRPTGAEPLLFHTMLLTGFPSQLPLLVASFLASQCCDAVLWFWLAPPLFAQYGAPGAPAPIRLPAHSAHRVVFKEFSAEAEFAKVAADFPRANASSLRGVNSISDIRFVTDWARMLLMYVYGGLWVDIDTVMLRDFRPLFALAPFAYRAGYTILFNNAVQRMGKRPHAVTRELLAAAIEKIDPSPETMSYTLGYARLGQAHSLHFLSQPLFDFMWMRFLRGESPELAAVHPEMFHAMAHGPHGDKSHEMMRGPHGDVFVNVWSSFFRPVDDDAELARRRALPFLPGSFSYHWHNRYNAGLPPRSWAGILLERYTALAEAKTVCAPGQGGGAGAGEAAV